MRRSFPSLLIFCGAVVALAGSAKAEIIYTTPVPAQLPQVPPGAWVANAPGISYGSTPSGYALQRAQAWRMQDKGSVPSANNYWLVLPGTVSGNVVYGHSASANRALVSGNDRVANTRSHVARANAYRMKLFER